MEAPQATSIAIAVRFPSDGQEEYHLTVQTEEQTEVCYRLEPEQALHLLGTLALLFPQKG